VDAPTAPIARIRCASVVSSEPETDWIDPAAGTVPDARQRHRPEIERLRGHGVSFRSAVIVGFGEVDGGSVAARNDEQ
jgi:hypothetical protein